MRKKFDAAWPTIMVIGAFFAGVLYANMPADGKWQPGWEMVSGLGTTAAAIAALWISGREERRVRQQAKVQAIIVAARIYLPLANYEREVKSIAEFFRATSPSVMGFIAFETQTKKIKTLLEEKVVEDVELGLLAGIGDNTAMLIAGAYGHMHVSLVTMNCYQWDFAQIGPSNIARRTFAHSVISLALNDAANQLRFATQSCQSAALAFTSPHAGPMEITSSY